MATRADADALSDGKTLTLPRNRRQSRIFIQVFKVPADLNMVKIVIEHNIDGSVCDAALLPERTLPRQKGYIHFNPSFNWTQTSLVTF